MNGQAGQLQSKRIGNKATDGLTISEIPSLFLGRKHSKPNPRSVDDLLSNEIGEALDEGKLVIHSVSNLSFTAMGINSKWRSLPLGKDSPRLVRPEQRTLLAEPSTEEPRSRREWKREGWSTS
jgi:hypothetical protein